jgi:radical SAM superfamily enzyme YgiQ (UPF0313 family)
MCADVALLTAEPWDVHFRRSHSAKRVEHVAAHLRITRADKERVERQHGVVDYFYSMGRAPIGAGPGAPSAPGEEERFGFVLPHLPHAGITAVATAVAAAGYDVRVVDNLCRYPLRMAEAERLLRAGPRVVALSTTYLTTRRMIRDYVKRVRRLAPDACLVLGGPGLRGFTDLHDLGDFVVFGPGEGPMVEILEALDGRRAPDGITHVAWRAPDGTLRYGPHDPAAPPFGRRGRPYDQRPLPIVAPDWRLARRAVDLVYPIEFSRGCKNTCSFCAHNRGKQVRPIADIRAELVANAHLGITRYRPVDSNFTDGPPDARRFPHEVCELMIELDLGLAWSCYARADDLTPELAGLMRRAGCFSVFLGVESGDDHLLRRMRKGFTAADALRGIATARAAGLRVHVNLVVGFPGETRASFERTLELVTRARPDSVVLSPLVVQENSWLYGDLTGGELRVEGFGKQWRHESMDSDAAYDLVDEGYQRLSDAGVHLGSSYHETAQLAYGYTVEDGVRLVEDVALLSKPRASAGSGFEDAVRRVRAAVLDRYPAAVARDQRAWAT